MSSSILVVGATGNTGRAVVQTLSEALKDSLQRILALTRSAAGDAAQRLATLPNVEVLEKNWVDISPDWLREHGVARAFIASHNEPLQFVEESAFHLAALTAGVDYVVRISTSAPNVRPDCPAYYPRAHWAVEQLLSSPAFSRLRWTSLRPNFWATVYLASAAEFVREHRRTGAQPGPLRLIASRDAPNGIVLPDDVGVLAARLLLEEDVSRHNGAKYEVNGPEDITGEQIVKLVEGYIGAPVDEVLYKDVSFFDQWAAQSPATKHLILSLKSSLETSWAGQVSASGTSREVLELAAPKTKPADVFKAMVEG